MKKIVDIKKNVGNTCLHPLLKAADKYTGISAQVGNEQTIIHKKYICEECGAFVVIHVAFAYTPTT